MKPRYDEKIVFFLVVENLYGTTVTLFERLDWKTPCLVNSLAS